MLFFKLYAPFFVSILVQKQAHTCNILCPYLRLKVGYNVIILDSIVQHVDSIFSFTHFQVQICFLSINCPPGVYLVVQSIALNLLECSSVVTHMCKHFRIQYDVVPLLLKIRFFGQFEQQQLRDV